MTISQTSGLCARNLPQHFNGCTCVAGPNGTLGEAIDIDLTVTDGGEATIPVPTEGLSAVIEAIENEPDLGGDLFVTGDAAATYDDHDGHLYDITIEGTAIAVKVRYTDISNEAYAFFDSPTAKTAVGMVKKAREQARDLDSFNAAADTWLKTSEDDKGIGWVEPEHDQDSGTISSGGVTISGFTRDPMWRHGPEMTVSVGDDYGSGDDPVVFTIAANPKTGYAQMFRGEDTTPLTHWEREAVDGRVQNLMNRGGYIRSLTELYYDAARRARHGS